jgi:hypothetical protein
MNSKLAIVGILNELHFDAIMLFIALNLFSLSLVDTYRVETNFTSGFNSLEHFSLHSVVVKTIERKLFIKFSYGSVTTVNINFFWPVFTRQYIDVE